MMTVVTHVPLREGSEEEWDSLMLERMKADPGWHEVVAEVRKGRAGSIGRSTAKATR
jgi:hypothetical protein